MIQNKGLSILSPCPLCHTRYQSQEAVVLEERGDSRLVYVRCQSCGSSIVAAILLNDTGASSMGLVTDLTGEEVLKFRRDDNITVDDALAVHEALDN